MKRICGYCYEPLDDEGSFFHEKCSQKFFGSRIPPSLPYTDSDLNRLAEEAVKSRTTVPGAQAKLSLHLEKSRGDSSRLTIVGLWGAFILKPPVEEYPFLPEIEDMTMHLATIAGIQTVPHALMPIGDGGLAYITKRVDRLRGKTGRKVELAKRHMEDLCQLAEKPAEYKYIGSMELMSKLVKRYSSNPGYDLTTFFDLVLFSFLVGNGDMHLKNVSLIYDHHGNVTLAPAYDLLSTRLIIPKKADPEEMALPVNGKKNRLKRSDFVSLATTSGLTEKQTLNAFQRITSKVPEMIDFVGKGFLPPEKTAEFTQLIQTRAKRLQD